MRARSLKELQGGQWANVVKTEYRRGKVEGNKMDDRMGGGEGSRERGCTYLYVVGPYKSKKRHILVF